jgi:ankyrin repeat protein
MENFVKLTQQGETETIQNCDKNNSPKQEELSSNTEIKSELKKNNSLKQEELSSNAEIESEFIEELKKNNFAKCRELYKQLKNVNFGNSNTDSKYKKEEYYYSHMLGVYEVYCVPDNRFINASNQTENPLMAMCSHRNLKAVKFLVEELNADVNYLSIYNTTAIMYAFQNGASDIVAYLLTKNALTEIKTLTRTIKMTDYAKGEHIISYMNLINYFISKK